MCVFFMIIFLVWGYDILFWFGENFVNVKLLKLLVCNSYVLFWLIDKKW